MDNKNYVQLMHLCDLYHTEINFFTQLDDMGLIEIVSMENELYVHQDKLHQVDRIIRIHRELNVNIEGVDVVFNLLEKVDKLQIELEKMQSRLRLYEDENDFESN